MYPQSDVTNAAKQGSVLSPVAIQHGCCGRDYHIREGWTGMLSWKPILWHHHHLCKGHVLPLTQPYGFRKHAWSMFTIWIITCPVLTQYKCVPDYIGWIGWNTFGIPVLLTSMLIFEAEWVIPLHVGRISAVNFHLHIPIPCPKCVIYELSIHGSCLWDLYS